LSIYKERMVEPIVIEKIVYSSYTPAQKRATEKWNKANWNKVLEAERLRYQRRRERLREFLELAQLVRATEHPEYIPPPPKRKYHRKYERDE